MTTNLSLTMPDIWANIISFFPRHQSIIYAQLNKAIFEVSVRSLTFRAPVQQETKNGLKIYAVDFNNEGVLASIFRRYIYMEHLQIEKFSETGHGKMLTSFILELLQAKENQKLCLKSVKLGRNLPLVMVPIPYTSLKIQLLSVVAYSRLETLIYVQTQSYERLSCNVLSTILKETQSLKSLKIEVKELKTEIGNFDFSPAGKLRRLSLTGFSSLSKKTWTSISSCPSLSSVRVQCLTHTSIPQGCFQTAPSQLSNTTSLSWTALSLHNCQLPQELVSEKNLSTKLPKLSHFSYTFDGPKKGVIKEAMAQLSSCDRLREVTLSCKKISEGSFKAFFLSSSRLTKVSLIEAKQLTNAALAVLLKKNKQLTHLSIREAEKINCEILVDFYTKGLNLNVVQLVDCPQINNPDAIQDYLASCLKQNRLPNQFTIYTNDQIEPKIKNVLGIYYKQKEK